MLAAQATTLSQLEDEAEMAVNEREMAESAAILARLQSAADAGDMPPPVSSFAYFRRRCSERYHHDFVRAPGVP
eukprot:14461547-Alexandrium_andersonii.AAC.1